MSEPTSKTSPRERGLAAAYGSQKRLATLTRHYAFGAALKTLTRAAPRPSDYLHFVPPVRNEHEMADLSARINCYLGPVEMPKWIDGPRPPVRSGSADYMDAKFVHDVDWADTKPKGQAHVIVHRFTPSALAAAAKRRGRATLAPAEFYHYPEFHFYDVRRQFGPSNIPSPSESLRRVRERAANGRSAFVLATGPSAQDVDVAEITTDIRITCNSAVRDLERLRIFNPTFIMFSDPVFHFGPSRYAAAFRADVIRAVEATGALLVIWDRYAPVLLDMHPELGPHVAAFPMRDGGPWHWPSDRDPSTRGAGNILTNLMLPIAFASADEVEVAGCDGRATNENYFWRHNTKMQYTDDLMQAAFSAHPAFFRDQDYGKYYVEHCRNLEEMFSLAESEDKVVRGVTGSHIPALLQRGAPRLPSS